MKLSALNLLSLLFPCIRLATGVSALAAPSATEQRRPNILFAIADDAGWAHMSAYGCKFVQTPAFDRVAREGIRFNYAFTSNPKCSPSRATILTGRYTWELQEACDHYGIFPAKFKVYPDLLESAGYFVGFTGKGWAPGNFAAGGFKRNPAGEAFQAKKLKPPTTGISAIDYAANFKAFLEARPKDKPFCFWYGGHEPHRPYELGSGLRAGKKLEDAEVKAYLPDDPTVRSDLLDYAVEIEWFDAQLGKMLKLLEAAGELDNTLVVVTSDNGMSFPRVKGQIYEDDFHLPLAICWKNGIPGNRVVDDFISYSDFAPTFLETAGLKPLAEMTGRSFLNLLRSTKSGQVDASRDRMFIGKERHDMGRPGNVGYPVRAIRTTDFLYTHNFEPDRWPAGDPETGYRNIDDSPTKQLLLQQKQQGQTKYYDLAMGKRPAEELFDLKHDPQCLNNLAGDPKYAGTKTKLWTELRQKLTEQKDPRILGHGEVFDGYKYFGNTDHTWDAVMGKTNQPAATNGESDFKVVAPAPRKARKEK